MKKILFIMVALLTISLVSGIKVNHAGAESYDDIYESRITVENTLGYDLENVKFSVLSYRSGEYVRRTTSEIGSGDTSSRMLYGPYASVNTGECETLRFVISNDDERTVRHREVCRY